MRVNKNLMMIFVVFSWIFQWNILGLIVGYYTLSVNKSELLSARKEERIEIYFWHHPTRSCRRLLLLATRHIIMVIITIVRSG